MVKIEWIKAYAAHAGCSEEAARNEYERRDKLREETKALISRGFMEFDPDHVYLRKELGENLRDLENRFRVHDPYEPAVHEPCCFDLESNPSEAWIEWKLKQGVYLNREEVIHHGEYLIRYIKAGVNKRQRRDEGVPTFSPLTTPGLRWPLMRGIEQLRGSSGAGWINVLMKALDLIGESQVVYDYLNKGNNPHDAKGTPSGNTDGDQSLGAPYRVPDL